MSTSQPENDADWREMAATRIVGDAPLGADTPVPGASEETVNSPRGLGKNVVAVGEYQLLKKLGEGAMGAVYQARQVSFDRVVALKVLFPHIASNPKLVERLYREGRTMGQLDHPNIVQAFAIGEDQGCHYVAMEFVDGVSMQKWLAKAGRLSVADAVTITIACARGLAYAHKQNIIHRDIKPDNILLTLKGEVKITDLGMVKKEDEDLSLTQTGHAVGTPWYMPMEQAKNAKAIDGRSDIYALGCTLYAFLTGHPPFAAPTLIDVLQAKDIGTFAPARKANPDVPERLDLIIAKMAAKLPQNRYANCDELIRDLEGLGLAHATLDLLSPKSAEKEVKPLSGEIRIDQLPSVEAPIDADVWYVRVKKGEGQVALKKYPTAKLRALLEEGIIDPTVKASHSMRDGYRALGTYKEFQGAALNKASRSATPQSTRKTQSLYDRIEEKERQRAASAQEQAEADLRRYWIGLGLKVGGPALAVLLLVIFAIWAAFGR